MAAWYRCHTSVFSLSDSSLKPSAYTWTIAASSTRSSRYLRSGAAEEGAGAVAGVPDVTKPHPPPPLPQATLPRIDMIASALFNIATFAIFVARGFRPRVGGPERGRPTFLPST